MGRAELYSAEFGGKQPQPGMFDHSRHIVRPDGVPNINKRVPDFKKDNRGVGEAVKNYRVTLVLDGFGAFRCNILVPTFFLRSVHLIAS